MTNTVRIAAPDGLWPWRYDDIEDAAAAVEMWLAENGHPIPAWATDDNGRQVADTDKGRFVLLAP